jgi:hypothetical protein
MAYLAVLLVIVATVIAVSMRLRNDSTAQKPADLATTTSSLTTLSNLAVATSSSVLYVGSPPRRDLTSDQRNSAELIVANTSDPVLAAILRHPYTVASIAPSYDTGDPFTLIGAIVTVRFAQPVSFVGDLPGGYRSPDGTPMNVEKMTTMYAMIEFTNMSIHSAIPGQDSIITVQQPH